MLTKENDFLESRVQRNSKNKSSISYKGHAASEARGGIHEQGKVRKTPILDIIVKSVLISNSAACQYGCCQGNRKCTHMQSRESHYAPSHPCISHLKVLSRNCRALLSRVVHHPEIFLKKPKTDPSLTSNPSAWTSVMSPNLNLMTFMKHLHLFSHLILRRKVIFIKFILLQSIPMKI
ncbi:hypothetical protein ILYODFUR_019729 [Ilyodon furcidens]|uniref:Uncharacterized protein n=1 Tax=Ilyodon furcidens TaxID=33524 RepID=A0ABV0TDA2_9TELE